MLSFLLPLTKPPTHHDSKPAHNNGAAVLQQLAALDDENIIFVVNDAFAIAHAGGRAMVNWADLVQAFLAWQGRLFPYIRLDLLADIMQVEICRWDFRSYAFAPPCLQEIALVLTAYNVLLIYF